MVLNRNITAIRRFFYLYIVILAGGTCVLAQSRISVQEVRPVVKRTIPHDTSAFTQGILYHDNALYESTGRYGHSSLRKLDAVSGAVITRIPVPDVFAEGLAYMNGKLTQLTWKREVALQYSLPKLQYTAAFQYTGEGWGLTSDEQFYIMSNGSDTLYWRDSAFTIKKKCSVTLRNQPLTNLNELEYARGVIYANVWHAEFIAEIDETSGVVRRIINCTALVQQAGVKDAEAVLNGIAYNEKTDLFYVTGKNWPLIFEVMIPKQD